MVLRSRSTKQRLLNIGCGPHYHPDWYNLDLVSTDPEVLEHDVRRRLPFDEGFFHGVYHSHILEHLAPDEGERFLRECFRVLKPGGVIRAVVPDLEAIVRTYLTTLERAVKNEPDADADHQWMTLELVDQMVRTDFGGAMAQFVRSPTFSNEAFVRLRVGDILLGPPVRPTVNRRRKKSVLRRLRKLVTTLQQVLSLAAVTMIEGRRGYLAYKEGSFRHTGEVHRWMYDRVSLRRLLKKTGFGNVAVVGSAESRIAGFDAYELDVVEGRLRKPDSLFIEAVKPACSSHSAARAAA